MTTKAVHVIPDKANGRWIPKKSGANVLGVFATRGEATAEARRLITGKAGQVVVLTRNGKIVLVESHGLPKVQRPAVRSKIGREAIESAVSAVVLARLTSA